MAQKEAIAFLVIRTIFIPLVVIKVFYIPTDAQ
jgi:hypothetical protein